MALVSKRKVEAVSISKNPKSRQAKRADVQWLRVRESLLRQIKEQVRRRLGPESKAIMAYMRHWEQEMRADWRIADKRTLVAAVAGADLVFGGDFHAFSQAQRTHLKILKALPGDRGVVLALEAFAPKHQPLLDAYSCGEIEEGELLRRSRWKSHWGFPWENYRPLAEFARERGYRLFAVGSDARSESLRAREVAASRSLKALFAKLEHSFPKPVVYVIFGDLHLSSKHLPMIAHAELEGIVERIVTIHLNPERLYFELARQGLESSVDVLRLGADRFCVLASPPWVQWQSYLMYLENTHDKGLHRENADDGVEWTDHVGAFVKLAAHDLGEDIRLDGINVYSAADSRLWSRLRSALNTRELNLARHCIQDGRSFFIPQGGIFFLARPSINHAAELAGHYIHGCLSRLNRPMWKMPGDFRALIWTEAVSFFISKLVNHKRHAETLVDLKTRLAVTVPRDQGREALVIAIEQRLAELLLFTKGRTRSPRLKPRHSASWLEAARILGGMMGERLYLAYRSRKISKRVLLSLLRTDPGGVGFAETYETIVRRLGPGTGALRTRKERL